jgi:large subunit ribosomal protein L32
MAVPKRKTTPSRRGMRSANKGLKPLNISVDKTTGEAKLPHRLSLKDGFYNGRQIIKPKVKVESEEESSL